MIWILLPTDVRKMSAPMGFDIRIWSNHLVSWLAVQICCLGLESTMIPHEKKSFSQDFAVTVSMSASAYYIHSALAYYSSDRIAEHWSDAHRVEADLLCCQLKPLHLKIKMPFHDVLASVTR